MKSPNPVGRGGQALVRHLTIGRMAVVLVILAALAYQAGAQQTPPAWKAALERVSPDSLRGHVSFLASDVLEGRNTPSRGLEIAAEYIASQYRRAGLSPTGEADYFRTSELKVREQNYDGFECTFRAGGTALKLSKGEMALETAQKLDLAEVRVVKVKPEEAGALKPEETEGKVLMAKVPDQFWEPQNLKPLIGLTSIMSNWPKLQPALLVMVDPSGSTAGWIGSSYPVRPNPSPLRMAVIVEKELTSLFDSLPYGKTEATLFLSVKDPVENQAKLHNVVGIIAGSDPALKDTCVVVSAHYDHLEPAAVGTGDRIFNGANDDASGVAGLLELASVLNQLPRKPKRSIVFAAFFGEEKGRLGSAAYTESPACALDKTVAVINLEQIGRTDSAAGPVVDKLFMTGFEFSDVGRVFAEAGVATGVTATRDEKYSERYFRSSDNASFALRGIPAHSVSVLFQFDGYHMPGDEWQRLDYANMAKVTRTIGLTVLMLADNPAAPRWDAANPKTAQYVEAQKKLLGK